MALATLSGLDMFSYPTILSEAECGSSSRICPLAPSLAAHVDLHSVSSVNAILSDVRAGCAWRVSTGETVYRYFRQWRLDGT